MYDKIYRYITSPVTYWLLFGTMLIALSAISPMDLNEGLYNYIARLWVQGKCTPYSGVVDNNPPGIFMLYALSNLFFGVNIWFPRLLGVIALMLSAFMLYRIGTRLYTRPAGFYALVLFGLSMTWPAMNSKFIAHTDSFMIFFLTASFYALVTAQTTHDISRYILRLGTAGWLLGCALSFKQTAIFTGAGLLFYYATSISPPYKKMVRDLPVFFTGVILALFSGIVPLLICAVPIQEYFDAVWRILFHYPKASFYNWVLEFFHIWRYSDIILFYPSLFLFFILRGQFMKLSIPWQGLVFLICWDIIGVIASSFLWGYDLRPCMPSIAVASGLAISLISNVIHLDEKARQTGMMSGIIIIFLVGFPLQTFFDSTSIFSAPAVPDKYITLGKWIQQNTRPDDYVYIYGPQAGIVHLYSDRVSPCRFLSPSTMYRSSYTERSSHEIVEKKPEFIIIPAKEKIPKWLKHIIDAYYMPHIINENCKIFLRSEYE